MFESMMAALAVDDGAVLASGSLDTTARLWRWQSQDDQFESLLGHTGSVYTLMITQDGKTLVTGSSHDNIIKLWDIATSQQRFTFTETGRNRFLAMSPDGKILASTGERGDIRLWRAATEEEARASDW